jgi:mannose-6-phosphate isomerase-like protein (cupin superfamily)
VVVSKENAEHYVWGGICDGWHLVKRADLSVIHERMPSGTSEVRHYHNRSRQFFFVLSGTATLEVDGKQEMIQALQGIEVPLGVPHQMMNQSHNDVEFIVISQPMSHGDRIELPRSVHIPSNFQSPE